MDRRAFFGILVGAVAAPAVARVRAPITPDQFETAYQACVAPGDAPIFMGNLWVQRPRLQGVITGIED